MPVPDRGGLRVESNQPDELRRYVFASPCEELRQLALSIFQPMILIKAAATEAEMRAHIPDHWTLSTTSRMMLRHANTMPDHRLPSGYRVGLHQEGDATVCQILAVDGSIAASGRSAEHAGVYCYDQIVTEASHRRKGLGRVVMAKLFEARRSAASQQILTATPDGQALYAALGWEVY